MAGSDTITIVCVSELDGAGANIVDKFELGDDDIAIEELDGSVGSDTLEIPPDSPLMVLLGAGNVKGVDAGDTIDG